MRKLNLICITSRAVHIPNFKSISQRMAKECLQTDRQTNSVQTKIPPGKPLGTNKKHNMQVNSLRLYLLNV